MIRLRPRPSMGLLLADPESLPWETEPFLFRLIRNLIGRRWQYCQFLDGYYVTDGRRCGFGRTPTEAYLRAVNRTDSDHA